MLDIDMLNNVMAELCLIRQHKIKKSNSLNSNYHNCKISGHYLVTSIIKVRP
jgi:hypothetical protein